MKDWGLSFENHIKAEIFLKLMNEEYDFKENKHRNVLGKRQNLWSNDSEDDSQLSEDSSRNSSEERKEDYQSNLYILYIFWMLDGFFKGSFNLIKFNLIFKFK